MCDCNKTKCGCIRTISKTGKAGKNGSAGKKGKDGKDGSLIEVTMSFTPAQIKAAHSAPIAIVPAPGAGYALVAEYCDVRRVPVTTPYTSIGLLITSGAPSGAGQLVTPSNFLTVGIISPTLFLAKMTPTAVNLNIYENVGLYLQAGTADSAVGDDLITVWLAYRKIKL